MSNTGTSAATLRTAAAALIAAAAVASCGADAVPAPASPPSTLSSTVDTPASASHADTTLVAAAAAAARNNAPLTDDSRQDASADTRMQAPFPAVIRIPRLGVEAPVVPLGLNDDGSMEVPEDPDQTGWWLGGPEPGEPGPAVIVGHVDSRKEGPGVFFRLRYMDPGDEIHIERVDGSTLTYVVEATERHNKEEFPTEAVYGPTEASTLRVITCGGDFDYGARSYQDNVIVFASLA